MARIGLIFASVGLPVLLFPIVTAQTEEFETECHILKTLETFEKTIGSLEKRLEEQDIRLGDQETRLEEQEALLREKEEDIAALKKFVNVINFARMKPTLQSSTYSFQVSSLAVDGNKAGYWLACSHTKKEHHPWWIVDLGNDLNVKSVVAYNRQDSSYDSYGARLSDVYVLVSSTLSDFKNNDLTGDQCGYIADHARTLEFTCAANTRGRYVKVVLGGTDYLTLCEVEVFVDV